MGVSRAMVGSSRARSIPRLSLGREARMGVKGIDHWVIVAADLERTLDFYARLGFSIAWEARPNRPGRGMPTIRINDAQKINVHGPDWPARPGYLGARRPSTGGPVSAPGGGASGEQVGVRRAPTHTATGGGPARRGGPRGP